MAARFQHHQHSVPDSETSDSANEEFASASEGDDDLPWEPVISKSPMIARKSPVFDNVEQQHEQHQVQHEHPHQNSQGESSEHTSRPDDHHNNQHLDDQQQQLPHHHYHQHHHLQEQQQPQYQHHDYTSAHRPSHFTSHAHTHSPSHTQLQRQHSSTYSSTSTHSSVSSSQTSVTRGAAPKLRERMRQSPVLHSKVVQAYLGPHGSSAQRQQLTPEHIRQAWLKDHQDAQPESSEEDEEDLPNQKAPSFIPTRAHIQPQVVPTAAPVHDMLPNLQQEQDYAEANVEEEGEKEEAEASWGFDDRIVIDDNIPVDQVDQSWGFDDKIVIDDAVPEDQAEQSWGFDDQLEIEQTTAVEEPRVIESVVTAASSTKEYPHIHHVHEDEGEDAWGYDDQLLDVVESAPQSIEASLPAAEPSTKRISIGADEEEKAGLKQALNDTADQYSNPANQHHTENEAILEQGHQESKVDEETSSHVDPTVQYRDEQQLDDHISATTDIGNHQDTRAQLPNTIHSKTEQQVHVLEDDVNAADAEASWGFDMDEVLDIEVQPVNQEHYAEALDEVDNEQPQHQNVPGLITQPVLQAHDRGDNDLGTFTVDTSTTYKPVSEGAGDEFEQSTTDNEHDSEVREVLRGSHSTTLQTTATHLQLKSDTLPEFIEADALLDPDQLELEFSSNNIPIADDTKGGLGSDSEGSDIYGDLSTARGLTIGSSNRLNEILEDDDDLEHMERGVPMNRSISTPYSDDEPPKFIMDDDLVELMERGEPRPTDGSSADLMEHSDHDGEEGENESVEHDTITWLKRDTADSTDLIAAVVPEEAEEQVSLPVDVVDPIAAVATSALLVHQDTGVKDEGKPYTTLLDLDQDIVSAASDHVEDIDPDMIKVSDDQDPANPFSDAAAIEDQDSWLPSSELPAFENNDLAQHTQTSFVPPRSALSTEHPILDTADHDSKQELENPVDEEEEDLWADQDINVVMGSVPGEAASVVDAIMSQEKEIVPDLKTRSEVEIPLTETAVRLDGAMDDGIEVEEEDAWAEQDTSLTFDSTLEHHQFVQEHKKPDVVLPQGHRCEQDEIALEPHTPIDAVATELEHHAGHPSTVLAPSTSTTAVAVDLGVHTATDSAIEDDAWDDQDAGLIDLEESAIDHQATEKVAGQQQPFDPEGHVSAIVTEAPEVEQLSDVSASGAEKVEKDIGYGHVQSTIDDALKEKEKEEEEDAWDHQEGGLLMNELVIDHTTVRPLEHQRLPNEEHVSGDATVLMPGLAQVSISDLDAASRTDDIQFQSAIDTALDEDAWGDQEDGVFKEEPLMDQIVEDPFERQPLQRDEQSSTAAISDMSELEQFSAPTVPKADDVHLQSTIEQALDGDAWGDQEEEEPETASTWDNHNITAVAMDAVSIPKESAEDMATPVISDAGPIAESDTTSIEGQSTPQVSLSNDDDISQAIDEDAWGDQDAWSDHETTMGLVTASVKAPQHTVDSTHAAFEHVTGTAAEPSVTLSQAEAELEELEQLIAGSDIQKSQEYVVQDNNRIETPLGLNAAVLQDSDDSKVAAGPVTDIVDAQPLAAIEQEGEGGVLEVSEIRNREEQEELYDEQSSRRPGLKSVLSEGPFADQPQRSLSSVSRPGSVLSRPQSQPHDEPTEDAWGWDEDEVEVDLEIQKDTPADQNEETLSSATSDDHPSREQPSKANLKDEVDLNNEVTQTAAAALHHQIPTDEAQHILSVSDRNDDDTPHASLPISTKIVSGSSSELPEKHSPLTTHHERLAASGHDSGEGEGDEGSSSHSHSLSWQDVSPVSVSKRSEAGMSVLSELESEYSERSMDEFDRLSPASDHAGHGHGHGHLPSEHNRDRSIGSNVSEARKGMGSAMSWTDLKQDEGEREEEEDEWHIDAPVEILTHHDDSIAAQDDKDTTNTSVALVKEMESIEAPSTSSAESIQDLPDISGADSWDFDQEDDLVSEAPSSFSTSATGVVGHSSSTAAVARSLKTPDINEPRSSLLAGIQRKTSSGGSSMSSPGHTLPSYQSSAAGAIPPSPNQPSLSTPSERATMATSGAAATTETVEMEDDSFLPLAIRQQRARLAAKGKPLPPLSKYKKAGTRETGETSAVQATPTSASAMTAAGLSPRISFTSPSPATIPTPVHPMLGATSVGSAVADASQQGSKYLTPALQKQRERLEKKRAAVAAATAATSSSTRRLTVTEPSAPESSLISSPTILPSSLKQPLSSPSLTKKTVQLSETTSPLVSPKREDFAATSRRRGSSNAGQTVATSVASLASPMTESSGGMFVRRSKDGHHRSRMTSSTSVGLDHGSETDVVRSSQSDALRHASRLSTSSFSSRSGWDDDIGGDGSALDHGGDRTAEHEDVGLSSFKKSEPKKSEPKESTATTLPGFSMKSSSSSFYQQSVPGLDDGDDERVAGGKDKKEDRSLTSSFESGSKSSYLSSKKADDYDPYGPAVASTVKKGKAKSSFEDSDRPPIMDAVENETWIGHGSPTPSGVSLLSPTSATSMSHRHERHDQHHHHQHQHQHQQPQQSSSSSGGGWGSISGSNSLVGDITNILNEKKMSTTGSTMSSSQKPPMLSPAGSVSSSSNNNNNNNNNQQKSSSWSFGSWVSSAVAAATETIDKAYESLDPEYSKMKTRSGGMSPGGSESGRGVGGDKDSDLDLEHTSPFKRPGYVVGGSSLALGLASISTTGPTTTTPSPQSLQQQPPQQQSPRPLGSGATGDAMASSNSQQHPQALSPRLTRKNVR
ncbi:hypothetical protein EDD11_002448 [Mortierella claussenii]|nr:hypothetical protein EDD11_002448 [Mortierella claussenii]